MDNSVYILDQNTGLYACYDSLAKELFFRPATSMHVLKLKTKEEAFKFIKDLKIDLSSYDLVVQVHSCSEEISINKKCVNLDLNTNPIIVVKDLKTNQYLCFNNITTAVFLHPLPFYYLAVNFNDFEEARDWLKWSKESVAEYDLVLEVYEATKLSSIHPPIGDENES